MRLLATISIQPHAKKKLTPEDLIPLPWDRKHVQDDTPKLSKEESRERFKELLHRLGTE